MADKQQQQPSGSAASAQHLGSLLAAAAATAAAGAAAAWYWRSAQRPHSVQRSGSAPATFLGIQTGADAASQRQHDDDVDGTTTPPLRADLAAKMATDSTSWVRVSSQAPRLCLILNRRLRPPLSQTHDPMSGSCISVHHHMTAALSVALGMLQGGSSSWHAAGALPSDTRTVSARVALQTDDADGGGWGAQLRPKPKVPVTSAKFSRRCCMSWQVASACQPDLLWRLRASR